MFFKTKHGSAVGDSYLSLIHTCELDGGNPFEYLAALPARSRHLRWSSEVDAVELS